MADERRQAQVELGRVEAAAQEIRSIAAEGMLADDGRASAWAGRGLSVFKNLSDSIGALDELGVDPAAAARMQDSSDELYAVGLQALGIGEAAPAPMPRFGSTAATPRRSSPS